MKFGQTLEISLVPEWRYQYIPYKELKKIIKSICKNIHAIAEEWDEEVRKGAETECDEGEFPEKEVKLTELEGEHRFFSVLKQRLLTANQFYVAQLAVQTARFEALVHFCIDRGFLDQYIPGSLTKQCVVERELARRKLLVRVSVDRSGTIEDHIKGVSSGGDLGNSEDGTVSGADSGGKSASKRNLRRRRPSGGGGGGKQSRCTGSGTAHSLPKPVAKRVSIASDSATVSTQSDVSGNARQLFGLRHLTSTSKRYNVSVRAQSLGAMFAGGTTTPIVGDQSEEEPMSVGSSVSSKTSTAGGKAGRRRRPSKTRKKNFDAVDEDDGRQIGVKDRRDGEDNEAPMEELAVDSSMGQATVKSVSSVGALVQSVTASFDAVSGQGGQSKQATIEYFREFYRGLTLLESFAVLNKTCVRKILKKHDKKLGTSYKDSWPVAHLAPLAMNRHEGLHALMAECESVFAAAFTKQNSRTRAMEELRVPQKTSRSVTWSRFRLGLTIGAALVFILICAMASRYSVTTDWSTEERNIVPLFIVFRMLSMIAFIFWYFYIFF